MKYPEIVQALDKILYLIAKQEISYRVTPQTAGNSDTC